MDRNSHCPSLSIHTQICLLTRMMRWPGYQKRSSKVLRLLLIMLSVNWVHPEFFPGDCLSKIPKSFHTRKAVATFQTIRSAHARGLVPATSSLKSLHEGTGRRDLSHEQITRSVWGTSPRDLNQNSHCFEFVGLVAGTKVGSSPR